MINDELAATVLAALPGSLNIAPESLSYELQDDFEFILLIVKCEDASLQDIKQWAADASRLLNPWIPGRKGEYSWMINFYQGTKVIESRFGGDVDSPDSGL